VTIEGNCGAFTSEAITLEVLASADAPEAEDVNIPAPGTATLLAIGDNVRWYDVPVGGTVQGTGNVWETPVVNTTTSFWASDAVVYGGGLDFGGPDDRAAQGAYHTNSDNYQFFEAYEPFVLRSVKVFANGAGNRTVRVIDRSNGSTVVQQVIDIPDGESRIELDFEIPGAGQYGLRTVGGNPQLWRDGLGSDQNYPYALGTVGAITSSRVGGNNATAYYYFFYDWEVEVPSTECEDPHEEVIVFVGSVDVEELAANDGIQVWPNPAVDVVNIAFGELEGRVLVEMIDVTGRIVAARNADARGQGGLMEFNVQGMAQGEYLVRVQHDGGLSTHRVVVR
jgi:hypothetical protein